MEEKIERNRKEQDRKEGKRRESREGTEDTAPNSHFWLRYCSTIVTLFKLPSFS